MKLGNEWWRTVRYAIKEERRTARPISILVVVGAIALAPVMIGSGVGVTVTIG
ncbi:hypothetical protein ACIPPR_23720 [Streptomyces nigra]|uniref:hypothetical protein n=1 Tax=Streptomyces nigra TaxID=1827580 RepID=UPI00381B53A2